MKKIFLLAMFIVVCVISYSYIYAPYREQQEIKNNLKTIYQNLVKINNEVGEQFGKESDNKKLLKISGDLLIQKNKLISTRGKIKSEENLAIYKNLYKSIEKHFDWIEAQKVTNEKYDKNQREIQDILSLGTYELAFGKGQSLMNKVDKLQKENESIIDKSTELFWSLNNEEYLTIVESYF